MAQRPEKLDNRSTPSFSACKAEPPPPPLQGHHSKQSATKCNHEMHPSAPLHTPYCPRCLFQAAQSKLEKAQDTLLTEGGLDRVEDLRNRTWVKARLAYNVALREYEKVRKRDQLRWEREHTWDEAHLQMELDRIGKREPMTHLECSACSSTIKDTYEMPSQQSGNGPAWWLRLGALSRPLGPKTEPKTRPRSRPRKQTPKGSPAMRSIIIHYRNALRAAMSERQIWERRAKIEAAVRRKHNIGQQHQYEPTFWDSPISGPVVRHNYGQELELKRLNERRARGNTLRPRPPRSSLSHCESAGELVVDRKLEEEMELAEAANELDMMKREVRRAGERVGYLYFVGEIDGMEEWKDDYLKSDHMLVWRDFAQMMEGIHQDQMMEEVQQVQVMEEV